MKVQAVKIQIIEKWSELDNKTVLKVLEHIEKKELLKALILLSDMTIEYYTSLPNYMKYELRKLVYEFAKSEFNHIMINSFKVNYFQKIDFVKADLSDITCLQWLEADDYFSKIMKGGEASKMKGHFEKMIASLVFIKDKTVANDLNNQKDINKVNQLKNYEKEYIFRRFMYIKKQVHELLKKQEMISDNEETSSDSIENFGWTGIFQDVAERAVFGNLSELMNEKFINVLTYLIRNKIKNDKILEEQNRKTALEEAKQ